MATRRPRFWSQIGLPSMAGDEESTSAGIYGIVVGAAVMATSAGQRAGAIVLAVLITLIVYWSAERYARIVAERIHDGKRPNWDHVRRELTRGWPLVTASFLPLIVLEAAFQLGAEVPIAVLDALICSTVLLGLAGWEIGRGGRLSTGERFLSAGVAALFGIGMILIKALLH